MQRKGLKLNPFLTMYYIAPASFGVLSVLWMFVEREAVLAHHFVSPLQTHRYNSTALLLSLLRPKEMPDPGMWLADVLS